MEINVTIWEKLMILRLVLEALALLPGLAGEIEGAVKEMHSTDPTGIKAQKAA